MRKIFAFMITIVMLFFFFSCNNAASPVAQADYETVWQTWLSDTSASGAKALADTLRELPNNDVVGAYSAFQKSKSAYPELFSNITSCTMFEHVTWSFLIQFESPDINPLSATGNILLQIDFSYNDSSGQYISNVIGGTPINSIYYVNYLVKFSGIKNTGNNPLF